MRIPGKVLGESLRALLVGCLLTGSVAWFPTLSAETYKEVTPAERAAIALALDYLQGGPEAWLDDLAPRFPWKSTAAVQEIELRAGPAEGARWRLATSAHPQSAHFHIQYPSGLDEVLVLGLVEREGKFQIVSLRAGWDVPQKAADESAGAQTAEERDAAVREAGLPAGSEKNTAGTPQKVLMGLLLLLGMATFLGAAVRRSFVLAGLGLALSAFPVWFFAFRTASPDDTQSSGPVAAAAADAGPSSERQNLLALRRRFALGREAALVELPKIPVARLWAAQEAVASHRLAEARELLAAEGLGAADASATASLIRARLASREGDDAAAFLAYKTLLQRWQEDEIFLAEAIQDFFRSDLEDKASEELDHLAGLQPRWPEAQVLLALDAAFDRRPLAAVRAFELSIGLGPVRRRELIGNPLATYLMSLSENFRASLALGAPTAPPVACERSPLPVLDVAPEVEATRVGDSLFLSVGSAELAVPGGCALLPTTGRELDAETWLEKRRTALLAKVDALSAELAAFRIGIPPALRQRLTEVLGALGEAGRFSEVVRLTSGLRPEALDSLVGEARRARVEALRETGRRKEAFELLVQLIGSDFDTRRKDPVLLFHLAELMAEEKQYELANRLYLAGDRRNPFEVSAQRRLQLKVEKKLLERSLVLERPPFKIYYSPARKPHFVQEIADYLISERQRLATWIPPRGTPKTIEVLLLDPDDFFNSYGFFVLGLYDGRVRVPLGQLRSINPFAASLLTHELSHALITEASEDRAPRWFQEGLAQLVEPGQYTANPIPTLKGSGKWVNLTLIEEVLAGMNSPELAQLGYEEALWASVYLHDQRGQKVFGELMAAWRQGAGEEEALRRVTGLNLAQLDQEVVSWGTAERVRLWETPKVPLPD